MAAASSTEKLSFIAGRYAGKDDHPVCIVRCQGEFPAVGEVLEPFASPILVEGWMRGWHMGPLMPVAVEDSTAGSSVARAMIHLTGVGGGCHDAPMWADRAIVLPSAANPPWCAGRDAARQATPAARR